MVSLALVTSIAIYYVCIGFYIMLYFWARDSSWGMAPWKYRIIVLWPIYLIGVF